MLASPGWKNRRPKATKAAMASAPRQSVLRGASGAPRRTMMSIAAAGTAPTRSMGKKQPRSAWTTRPSEPTWNHSSMQPLPNFSGCFERFLADRQQPDRKRNHRQPQPAAIDAGNRRGKGGGCRADSGDEGRRLLDQQPGVLHHPHRAAGNAMDRDRKHERRNGQTEPPRYAHPHRPYPVNGRGFLRQPINQRIGVHGRHPSAIPRAERDAKRPGRAMGRDLQRADAHPALLCRLLQ